MLVHDPFEICWSMSASKDHNAGLSMRPTTMSKMSHIAWHVVSVMNKVMHRWMWVWGASEICIAKFRANSNHRPNRIVGSGHVHLREIRRPVQRNPFTKCHMHAAYASRFRTTKAYPLPCGAINCEFQEGLWRKWYNAPAIVLELFQKVCRFGTRIDHRIIGAFDPWKQRHAKFTPHFLHSLCQCQDVLRIFCCQASSTPVGMHNCMASWNVNIWIPKFCRMLSWLLTLKTRSLIFDFLRGLWICSLILRWFPIPSPWQQLPCNLMPRLTVKVSVVPRTNTLKLRSMSSPMVILSIGRPGTFAREWYWQIQQHCHV